MSQPRTAAVVFLVATLGVPVTLGSGKRVAPVAEAEVAAFEKGDRFAVVVGIGRYPPGSGLAGLAYAAADARALGEMLEAQEWNVRVITDEQATGGAIRSVVRAASEAVDRERGTLLFYFSGHGFAGGQSRKNYLAVYETAVDELDRTGLGLDEILGLLESTPVRRRVVLIDACRNDPGAGAKSAGLRSMAAFEESEGVAILFSTRIGGISYEHEDLAHGLFTHFLLEGLSGKAAKDDGLITFRDLADYTEQGVKAWAYSERGWSQVPFVAGERHGEFLLGRGIEERTTHVSRIEQGSPSRPDRRTGDAQIRDADGMKEVWVPAGSFLMGSSRGNDDEKPVHRVRLTRGFWLDEHEVTKGQYRRVLGSVPGRCDFGEQGTGGTHPVVCVTWDEARSYCQRVGGRLPTEAEWEYAARGSVEGKTYPWGDQNVCGPKGCRANGSGSVDGLEGTSPVCSYTRTGHGHCDMAGNVWEWVWDWYSSKYGSGEQENPEGPSSGDMRVLRGGSWRVNPTYLRVAYRDRLVPDYRISIIGFRCARDSE